jgi:hypothetical protein
MLWLLWWVKSWSLTQYAEVIQSRASVDVLVNWCRSKISIVWLVLSVKPAVWGWYMVEHPLDTELFEDSLQEMLINERFLSGMTASGTESDR